jgi:WD40 repeat protein
MGDRLHLAFWFVGLVRTFSSHEARAIAAITANLKNQFPHGLRPETIESQRTTPTKPTGDSPMIMSRYCLWITLAIGLFGALPAGANEPGKEPKVDLYGDSLPDGAVARLGTIRLRQPNSGSVAVAFSKDGKILATGGDNSIRLWSTTDGRLLGQIQENYGGGEIVFSPDGKSLATPTEQAICLLDTTTGKLIRRISNVGFVFGVSPDGKLIALAGTGGSVTVRSTGDGKEVQRWSESKLPASLVNFTSDGKFLLALTRDKKLYRWELAKGKLDKVIPLAAPGWENVALSGDGKTLALNPSTGASAEVWDIEGAAKKFSLAEDGISGKLGLAFSPDGKKLVSDWKDAKKGEGGIAVWDASNGKIIRRIPMAVGGQITLHFAPDGQALAAFSGGASIQLWDSSTGRQLLNFPAHAGSVTTLSFTADGKKLVSAGDRMGVGDSIRVWDTSTGRQLQELANHRLGFNRALFLPNGKEVLSGGSDGMLFLQSVEKAGEIRRFSVGGDSIVSNLGVTSDGKRAASLSLVPGGQMLLQVWDIAAGKPVINHSNQPVLACPLHFSPDATLLVRQTARPRMPQMNRPAPFRRPTREQAPDQTVIQEVATAKSVLSLSQPDINLGIATFTRDNQILATATFKEVAGAIEGRLGACEVHLWELISGRECQTISISNSSQMERTQMAFSPNQRTLAIAGQVNRNAGSEPVIRLWDVVTAKEILSRKGFESEVTALAFTNDGNFLASGHTDGTILIWDLARAFQLPTEGKAALEQMESWWSDLGDEDAKKAEIAIWALVGAGQPAVDLMRKRLHPAVAPPADQIQHLIANLNSNDFQQREKASRELAAMEELAQTALKEALKGKPSAEQRRRIDKLLELNFFVITNPETRRQFRAIRALERIGNSDARKALAELAQGAPEMRLSIAAKSALQRLEQTTPLGSGGSHLQ